MKIRRAKKTHVCDTKRRQIVPLAIFATHPLALRATGTGTHRRRHVRALLSGPSRTSSRRPRSARLIAHARSDISSAGLADGGHGVLVGTTSSEMLAVADTALDLLILKLVLHGLGVGVVGLVLGLLAPVDRGAEDDVLADRRGVGRGALGVAGRVAELGPRLALRHPRVDDLAAHHVPHAPRRLDLLPQVVDPVLDDGPCPVLVLDLLRRGQVRRRGCRRRRLLEVLVVRPVVPASPGVRKRRQRNPGFFVLTLFETPCLRNV